MTISKTLSALYTRQKTFTFIVQVVPCLERAITSGVGHGVFFGTIWKRKVDKKTALGWKPGY